MAYETSAANDINGVVDALRIFAIAQGWTIHTYESMTNGMWLCLSKSTCVMNLVTDSTWTEAIGELKIRGATSYDGGLDFDKQPGMKTDTTWSQVNDVRFGPFVSHHFFAGDDFIHVVVESSSGRYTHFGFGILDKAGDYVGGEYCYGTHWTLNSTTYSGTPGYAAHVTPFSNSYVGAFVRFEEHDCLLTTYNNWVTVSGSTASSASSITGRCINCHVHLTPLMCIINSTYVMQPNYFNGVCSLWPLVVESGRRGNQVSILGAPKELRYMNMFYASPGEELVLGSDTWMVFPQKQKGNQIVGNTTPFSLWHGHAYKKVV